MPGPRNLQKKKKSQHRYTAVGALYKNDIKRAGMRELDVLQAQIFRVSTSEEALSLVSQIRILVNVPKKIKKT